MAKYLSSGIIPVFFKNGQFQVLVLRAYSYWDFPKGLVKPGEDPLIAALRELKEETGIANLRFRWGEDFYETSAYSTRKIARYYLAEVRSPRVFIQANPENGLYEHHEYRWLNFTDARKLLVPRVQNALNWASLKIKNSPHIVSKA